MPRTDEMPDELMAKYNAMTESEDADNGIPLGAQREREAIERAMKLFSAARELIANGMLKAAGYRVVVKTIEATKGLEAAEAQIAPTLAERGFEAKTHEQKLREDRGENHGIVIDIGPIAFDRLGGREAWCDVGDTVVFTRYAGTRVEHPPGSGAFYQIMNDEDIAGKIV